MELFDHMPSIERGNLEPPDDIPCEHCGEWDCDCEQCPWCGDWFSPQEGHPCSDLPEDQEET